MSILGTLNGFYINKLMKTNNPIILNKKARHDYTILQTFNAGLVLKGWEIKSIPVSDLKY